MSDNSSSAGGRFDADSVTVLGSGGSGYVELTTQGAMSAAAAGGTRIFTNNVGDFSIIDDQVNAIALNLAGLTASRSYTMPDADGALVGSNAAQTLTNKTILASGGNNVDATSLQGFSISGTPTAGQYLKFGGAAWSPQTISATSPANFLGDTISIDVGNVGGVASFTDPRFTTPQIINVRTGTAGYGEFTSVAAAVASITDATTTKRYVIYVGAGIFYEPAMTMKPFVYIRGFNKLATIIRPNAAGLTLITASSNGSIEECMFLGIGDGIGINVDSCNTSYFGNLTMMNFGTCMRFAALTAATDTLLHEFLYYGPCQYGIVVDGTIASSPFFVNVSLSMGRFRGDAGVVQGLRFVGPNAKLSANSIRSVQCTTGIGCYIDDTANVELGNSKITDCASGLIIGNVGGAPFMVIRDTLFLNNIVDINMAHPGATGLIDGIANRNKITIDPASQIAISYVDLASKANIITGEFFYSPANDAILTETGSLIVNGAPVGCYEGGIVTAGAGVSADVAAGLGYINATASAEYMLKCTWSATNVVLVASTDNYVCVNYSGVFADTSVPDQFTNILLARVRTTATGVEFVDGQLQSSLHPSTRNVIAKRETSGPLYVSGSVTTLGVGNVINVTAGVYYYLNNRFAPIAASPVTYVSYIRDGLGGWTLGSGTTATAQYDNNSGTPVAIPVGKYARALLYIVSGGAGSTYMYLYGQAIFDSEIEAANDDVTVPPNYFDQGITAIASFTSDSAANIIVRDMRSIRSFTGNGTIATVVDHGELTGLAQDDHLQYLLVNGTRAMSGALDMGTFDVSNAGTYNGVTVQTHASRHLPNGADPLTTAAPIATITSSSVNAVGTANSFARSDHSHAIDVSGYNINSFGGSLSVGNGGTGTTLLTIGRVLIGNGPSSVNLSKPAPTGSFVGTTDAQVLTNKNLQGSTTRILNTAGDGQLTLTPGVGAFTANFDVPLTSSYTLSFPAITDTVTTATNTQTFNNKNIRGGSNGNDVYANFINNPSNPVILPNTPPGGTGLVLVIAGVPNAVWGDINSIAGNLSVPNGGTNRTTLTANGVLVGNGINPVDTTKQAPVGDFVGTTDAQILTNKTLGATTTTIQGTAGNTLTFSPTGATSFVTTGAATITFPSGTRTLDALDTVSTLTNKTITDATNDVAANSIKNNSGVVTTTAASPPIAGQVLTALTATTASWQTPSAGPTTFSDATFAIYDSVDNTKQVRFDAAGTTGTTTTIVSTQTGNVSISLPNATDTLVARTTIDTLTNKTLTAPVIATIVNTGTLTLPTSTDTLVGRATTDTLTNKTLVAASTTISGTGTILFTAGGTSSTTFASAPSTPVVLTLPTSTDTLVGRATTDNLSNKTLAMASTTITDASTRTYNFTATGTASTTLTLTSAITASRALTFPDISDTLVTKTTTDTFSNKSITGGASGNTVAANFVRAVLINAVAPTVGQVLTATTTTDAVWATPSVTTVTGVLPVANGGTSLATLTTGRVLVGAGTSAVDLTKVAPTGAFVGTTDTQTLSGKTLTAPVIATISNGGTLTLPTGTETLVGRATTDTLTNKTLSYTTSSIDVNLITGISITGTPVDGNGIYMTGTPGVASWGSLNLSNAASVIGTLPVARGGTGAASLLSGNLLTGNGTGAIQATTAIPTGGLVGVSAVQTLSNKKLTAGNTSFEGASVGVDLLSFIPSGADTLVFTGPTTATIPAGTVSIVAANSTDVLTNKTITSPTNTVAAQQLFTASGTVSVSASAAPTVGQMLIATSASTATWQTYVGTSSFADNLFNIYDSGDPTVRIVFAANGTTTTQTTINANQTSNISLDLPIISTTLVGRTTTDTLTNKTLTNPTISAIVNGGTLTLPTGPGTIVARASTDTLTNKTITSTTNTVAAQQLHNASGTVSVSASAAPSAGQTLVASSGTVAAWAFPSMTSVTGVLAVANGGTGNSSLTSNGVLVGNGTGAVSTAKAAPTGAFVGTTDTQTLSGKTLTSPVISTISNTGTLTLPTSTDTLVGRATTDTLTNKTLTSPVISTISNIGTLTLPTSTDTLVGRATTDTLTNKTLTAPVISTIINTGTLTLPTSTDTLVGRATSDPFTNKTITSTTNTVAAQQLHNATGTVSVSASAAPTAGQTLVATSASVAAWTSVARAIATFNFYNTSNATSYTNVSGNNAASSFSYPGSTAMGGTITRFQFTASLAGASSYNVRLQDVTNGLTIATVTPVSTVASTIYSSTTISNVPTGPAELQIQAIRTGASGAIQIRGWTVMF